VINRNVPTWFNALQFDQKSNVNQEKLRFR